MQRALVLFAALGAVHCFSGGAPLDGLAPANDADRGPRIVFDLFEKPLPNIPFPNDVGTRPDLGSPTGRRINISTDVSTQLERRTRELVNQLDGFGTYAPITVAFEEVLDLTDLHARHDNLTFDDDAVFVVAIDPKSPQYGVPVPLDLGSGRFPVAAANPGQFFMNDPRATASSLLFETLGETDTNGNGLLDLDEDVDHDGVLDQPNTWGTYSGDPLRNDMNSDVLTFYELETNTLIVRPILPLEEQTRYAVVLTRRLRGKESASPIRSPFAAINHVQQTPALRPLVEDGLLANLGLEVGDVAFAWSFTTQSVKGDLEAIRAGLYGIGTLSGLGSAFKPVISQVLQVDQPQRIAGGRVLKNERALELLEHEAFADEVASDEDSYNFILGLMEEFVDYFVVLQFESPALHENEDGVFRLNRDTGEIEYDRATITMLCGVPKARGAIQPPFPVALFSHGYGSSKFEGLIWSMAGNKAGIVVCGFDAYGHGLPDDDFVRAIMDSSFSPVGLEKFGDALLTGRARDLNDDGVVDPGGDFWSYRTFHTRDNVRQTAVDHYQAVRVMRQFGKGTMSVDVDGDGDNEVNGDFNGDGVADFGGDQSYYMTGGSLGGIMTMVVGSTEPWIRAAAPVVGGAGLSDISVRRDQGGTLAAIYGHQYGPLITARPSATFPGRFDLVQNIPDVRDVAEQNGEEGVRFAAIPDPTLGLTEELAPGDRVRLLNLDNGELDEASIGALAYGGLFRVAARSDKGDRIRFELYRKGATEAYRVIDTFEREVLFQGKTYAVGEPLVTLEDGWAFKRGTPPFRRMVGIGQMILEPGDPANYAKYYAEPYAIRPEGKVPTPLLVVATNGDTSVPLASAISFSRIAGAVNFREIDPRYGMTQDQLLTKTYTAEGLSRIKRFEHDPCHYDPRSILFDIDDLSNGTDPDQGPSLAKIARPPECDGGAGAPAYCATSCAPMPPLRASAKINDVPVAMRFIYVRNQGRHGFSLGEPSRAFDYGQFATNQMMRFLKTEGAELTDEPCLHDSSCSFFDEYRGQ